MYTADFETNTHTYDVSVWAYAICDIKNVENVVSERFVGFFSALDSIEDDDINTITDAFVVLNNDIEKGIAKEKTSKKSILIKKDKNGCS